jgi:hypothetical protein
VVLHPWNYATFACACIGSVLGLKTRLNLVGPVTTEPAAGPFLGAVNRDDQFALFVQLGSDETLSIGNVQRYGDLSSCHLQPFAWTPRNVQSIYSHCLACPHLYLAGTTEVPRELLFDMDAQYGCKI